MSNFFYFQIRSLILTRCLKINLSKNRASNSRWQIIINSNYEEFLNALPFLKLPQLPVQVFLACNEHLDQFITNS